MHTTLTTGQPHRESDQCQLGAVYSQLQPSPLSLQLAFSDTRALREGHTYHISMTDLEMGITFLAFTPFYDFCMGLYDPR